jgi:negative regulator of sigma E activity
MKKENIIDNLLKEQESISNEALKNALQRQIEEESKQQEETLLYQFKQAKEHLNYKVTLLRKLREGEKRAKKEVINANNALEQFKKDGDWDKFLKNC